ncbi:MAG: DNA repair exonuclease [Nanoarchaeota archaeon]|nr:DNA repair exonuclease [Nanoarchaeota archaeon]MBU1703928.1 DNA repair exonuclease [Nanoarchaeota archaeon]
MKFAHLADCHIGSWRDPKLKDISTRAFVKAVDLCTGEKVDFILIAGDLFNTSLPGIEFIKAVTKKLKEVKDLGIRVYVIAGSHDFSPSGKTMLDVLEHADLFVNVAKGEAIDGRLKLNFTVDEKTGAKITGLLGKRGGLEKSYYEDLYRENLESEPGFKIFMFHSLLTELKPKDLEKVDSQPLSLLPKTFDYYAGGHPHFVENKKIEGYGVVAYPGPLFPNNFRELEKLGRGGFYIYDGGKLEWYPVQVYNAYSMHFECNHKSAEQVNKEIFDMIKSKEFFDTIVTLRLDGVLDSGKVSDIDFKQIFSVLYEKSAYFVMKNTNGLSSKEFEQISVDSGNIEETEDKLIKEHLGQIKVEGDEDALIKQFMQALSLEKNEGEKVADFERRLVDEVKNITR